MHLLEASAHRGRSDSGCSCFWSSRSDSCGSVCDRGGCACWPRLEFLKLAEAYSIKPFTSRHTFLLPDFLFFWHWGRRAQKPVFSTATFVYAIGFAAAISAFIFLTIGMSRADLSSAFPAATSLDVRICYVALPMGFWCRCASSGWRVSCCCICC